MRGGSSGVSSADVGGPRRRRGRLNDTWIYAQAVARVAARRPFRGARRPGWSWTQEILAESLRLQGAALAARGWDRVDWVHERACQPEEPPALPALQQVEVVPRGRGRVASLDVIPRARPGDRSATSPWPRAVLYLPGGGYTQGCWGTHGELAARFAVAVGAPVVFAQYRLAPEAPFPAAVEDVVELWQAVVREVPASSCALLGDSAGGGLALGALLALRDAGAPLPAATVCLSPWVDLTLSSPSFDSNADVDWCVAGRLRSQAAAYLGGASATEPWASPLFGDLRGLPPMFVQAGTAEVLLDDARRLAERVRAAGGEVELDLWPEHFHCWQLYPDVFDEARVAVERAAAFVRRAIGDAS